MRRIFDYIPSDQTLRRGKWLVIVLFVAVLIVSVWAVLWLARENDILNERDRQSLSDRQALRERLDKDEAAIEALTEQLRLLGEKPAVEPDDVSDLKPGEVVVIPGPPGRDGRDGADGRNGRNGRDGIGQPGRPGSNGAPGQPGPTGPAGPRGQSCIEALSLAECKGPKGDPGVPGKDGTTPDLTGYATQAWVIDLIRALGCEVTAGGEQGPPLVLTCSITGKP